MDFDDLNFGKEHRYSGATLSGTIEFCNARIAEIRRDVDSKELTPEQRTLAKKELATWEDDLGALTREKNKTKREIDLQNRAF